MGKKGFNWKARQNANVLIDNSDTKNISLELDIKGHYDSSNELLLPSKKRKTKIKKEKIETVRILSKKQRKKLEKIVEKKHKKDNRANILEQLQKVQLPPEQRDKFTSLSSVQTKGLKRILKEPKNTKKLKTENENGTFETIELKQIITQPTEEKAIPLDPNTVGFESSSSDDSSSEEEIDENKSMTEKIEEKEENGKIETKEVAAALPVKIEKKPAIYVDVLRDPAVQESRLKLPVLAEEQQIMETINANAITIISGETGSGKTTQIPQFLYEAGYAMKKMIAITEPRRIAAISMSERVAQELNLTSKEVSYLVRFQGNVTDETKIKFMTDGVLLKEVQSDFLLSKYSVVILDEAHERSLYTDILIGLLSRIVRLREKKNDPLKLIIMSATLRLEDFTSNQRLFKNPPPTINVEARQYPVTIHFNRRTNEDYLNEAFRKTVKIHSKLPEGGVLVFVTGQAEVRSLVSKLRKKFPLKEGKSEYAPDENKKRKSKKVIKLPEINLEDYSLPGDKQDDDDDEGSDLDLDEEIQETVCYGQPLWVLPLYSLLSVEKQNRIFQKPPEGCRLCVVSTNVAETSLTIPGIKYVVDTGKTKMKMYDKLTGVSSFVVWWTSKASADQRAGRAGRMGPGHCYRLYSSAVFNDTFVDFSEPEIKRAPSDDLYLRMRSMNIEKIVNFPFPTAPDLLQLKTAETRLKILGVLDEHCRITMLGKAVAKFPVLPRFGKMLALSHQHDILPYTICLVAALSVPQILVETTPSAEVQDKLTGVRLRWAGTGNSFLLGDNMVLLKAVGAAEFANYEGKLERFCIENGLRSKAITEIRKLRIQLTSEIAASVDDIVVDPKMQPPTDLQAKLLRQILLSGLGDQIAKKMTVDEVPSGENKSKYKYAYHANNMEDLVYLHRNSVLKKTLPEFVIYQELYETNKIYMRGITAIEPEWLPIYVPSLCNLSAPLTDPPPSFTEGKVMCSVTGTFGSQAWSLPEMRIEFPESEDAYKWFATFFLNGDVIDSLRKFKSCLLSQPNIMTKTWAKLQPRTQSILRALLSRNVRRKNELLSAWRDEPNYLLNEYLEWLPQSAHSEIMTLWPPNK